MPSTKAMGYIKQTCCPEMSLQEFTAEWKALSAEDQEQLRKWAREEGKALGITVE